MKHGKPYHECAFRIVNGYQYIYWAGDDLSTVRRVADESRLVARPPSKMDGRIHVS